MELLILGLLTVIIVLLLFVYRRLSGTGTAGQISSSSENSSGEAGRGPGVKKSPCPLCKTLLVPGERVKSVVYPGKGDRLVEIYGCPYCYPPNHRYPRYCPSCKRELNQDELVFARMFDTSGKAHMHVNGCRVCMRRSP